MAGIMLLVEANSPKRDAGKRRGGCLCACEGFFMGVNARIFVRLGVCVCGMDGDDNELQL